VTESEWLAGTNHIDLIRFVASRVNGGKSRLFAVACCRRQESLFMDQKPCYWQAVDVAERYASGQVSLEELARMYDVCDNDANYERDPVAFYVQNAALSVTWKLVLGPPELPIQPDVLAAESTPVHILDAMYRTETQKATVASAREICDTEEAAQLKLLHEIIGNPFRSTWNWGAGQPRASSYFGQSRHFEW
jgi:hypothetical protein